MATEPLILFPGTANWRIGTAETDVDADWSVEQIAARVAGSLRDAGYNGEGILLAIPSGWCLCAAIETRGLPARNRRQAMSYRLEEKLPLAAEDVFADFLPVASGDAETLGVCVEKSKLSPMVEALESAGVAIGAICPAGILAAQAVLPTIASVDAILLPASENNALDLFILRNGKVHSWYLVGDQQELRRHLAVEFHKNQTAVTVAVGAASSEIHSALSAFRVIDIQACDSASLATSILSGKTVPWIDFQRSGLAGPDPLRTVRTPLTFALSSVAMCMLCLCGAMLWRARQYDQLASRHADEQQQVFHQAFPNDPAPIDVLSRLTAEQRRLHGLSGDASTPAQSQNGLVMLRDLIMHLPAADQLRYRMLEIQLNQNQFKLEGQTAGHGDADAIASSLRKGGGFKVDAPKTEQLGDPADSNAEKGVTFTITGAAMAASTDTRRSTP